MVKYSFLRCGTLHAPRLADNLIILINYLYYNSIATLECQYPNFKKENKNYKAFLKDNEFWLNDYALFEVALKVYDAKNLYELPEEFKYKMPEFLCEFEQKHKEKIEFYNNDDLERLLDVLNR